MICLVEATTSATEVDNANYKKKDSHATDYNASNCAAAEAVPVSGVVR